MLLLQRIYLILIYPCSIGSGCRSVGTENNQRIYSWPMNLKQAGRQLVRPPRRLLLLAAYPQTLSFLASPTHVPVPD